MPAFQPQTGSVAAVRVEGLAELNRAFARFDRDARRELRRELDQVAEPVRAEAETLAAERIRRIGVPWSRMRTGFARSVVYVAPVKRGRRRGRYRPNLAALLMDRAMLPALDRHRDDAVARVDALLGRLGGEWSR